MTPVDALTAALDAGRITGNTRYFATSLLRAAGSKRGASPSQAAWITKLVEQSNAPKPEPEQIAGSVGEIFRLFRTASERGLKYPKIHLRAQDGTPVVFVRAGAKSKYTGQVQITDGGPYGANRYFGRIDEAGNFTAGRDVPASVRALIDAFAANPAAVAAAYGKETGSCCFCHRTLETEDSTEVGYGPVCAEKFDLPWGKKS